MPEGFSLGWGSRPAARAASGGRPRVTVLRNQRGPLLLQPLDQLALLGHQGVDPRRLYIEEVGEGFLLALGGKGARKSLMNSGGTRFCPPAPYISASPKFRKSDESVM